MPLVKRPARRCAAVLAALGAATMFPSAALADATGCGNTVIRPLGSAGGGGAFSRASIDTFVYTATDTPVVTVDGSTVSSTVNVTALGSVRMLKVTIGQLTHPTDSELRLTLVAPDGTRVVLADGIGGAGANYTSTVFTVAAPNVLSGSAPFTGSFSPQGDFGAMNNKQVDGAWRLEVRDAAGGATGTLSSWTLEVTRQPCGAHPTAALTATPVPVTPGSSTTFDASASSGTNGAAITKYEWDLDGDGIFETDTGAVSSVSHSYATKAVVPVGLRVTDSTLATDEIVFPLPVTVAPAGSFTVAPAAPMSLQPVTLDASASTDPDGMIVRYEWDLDGNGTFEIDQGNAAVLQSQFATSGARNVHLRVTDEIGARSIATMNVVVENRVPTAAFSVQGPPALVGVPTTLDAAASSDPDGTVARYEWDLDDNGSFETDAGAARTVQYTWAASGTYFASLRVTDNLGATNTIRTSFVATRAPVAQLAASATEVRPNTVVTFDPAGSADPDPGGTIVQYAWDFDGDGTADQTGTSPTPVTHSYPALGTYNATLVVTDDIGAKGTRVVVISVVNKLPVAALSVTPTPAQTGQVVVFDAAGSRDPDGTVTRYQWDLDGNGIYETDTGTVSTAARAFPNRLRITVRVRVTDNDGATGSASAALAVDAPAGAGGGAGTGGPADGPGAGNGSKRLTFKASLLGAPIQRLRRALARGVGVVCKVDRTATCSVEVVVLPRDAKRLGLATGRKARKPVRVGRARVVTSGSGRTSLKLELSRRARRALRRARRSVVLVVRGTATDGSGTKVLLKRAVLIRR